MSAFNSQEILEKALLCVGVSGFVIPGLLLGASQFKMFVYGEFAGSFALFCYAAQRCWITPAVPLMLRGDVVAGRHSAVLLQHTQLCVQRSVLHHIWVCTYLLIAIFV